MRYDLTHRDMLTTVEKTVHEDSKHTPNDLAIDDITDTEEAVELWRAADRQLAAARIVRDVAGVQLAGLLGDGGAARIGPSLVRFKIGRKERCIDPDQVAAYVTDQIRKGDLHASDIVNPNAYRKTWMEPAVRSTFYEYVDDDHPSLQTTQFEKAPKFLQHLEDGDTHVA